MAMADCYCVREQQLEDDAVVHRLLPPEILVEIGTAADHAAAHDAVVEELAARLVGILGLTSSAAGAGKKRAAAATSPPPTSAIPSHSHYPHAQYSRVRREQHLAGGGIGVIDGGIIMPWYHAPGFGTTQWLPPPPRPTTFVAPPPAWCGGGGGGGTGVFLPRGVVYPTRKQQLEDAVVHRLLPPEILVEIGIAADHAAAHDAVVEELAARLVGILGLSTSAAAGGMGEKKRGVAAAPPTTTSGAATPSCSHPHAHRSHTVRREQHLAGGGVIDGGMALRHHAAPVFATKQWPPPPPRPTFAGTGVFLPRSTEVSQTRNPILPGLMGRGGRIRCREGCV
uniref:Uncharacterized protein n=1 Tax=Oryza punctata TaxID=4537 RepID=A0A0E0MCP9_ORYPU